MPNGKNKAKNPERVVRQNKRNIVPPNNLPSAKEIALIASNLIGENRYIENPVAIDRAFDLLRQAEDKLEDIRVEKANLRFHKDSYENEMEQIAKQTKVQEVAKHDFNSFLKMVVGGQTKGERLGKFKRFLEANLNDSTPEEMIQRLERNGFENMMAWMGMGESYQVWFDHQKRATKVRIGKATQAAQAVKRIDEQINSVGKNLPPELNLNSFFNKYMNGKKRSVAMSLFKEFLKSLPENKSRPLEVRDDVAKKQESGFSKSAWVENASKYLKWKKSKIENGEHS